MLLLLFDMQLQSSSTHESIYIYTYVYMYITVYLLMCWLFRLRHRTNHPCRVNGLEPLPDKKSSDCTAYGATSSCCFALEKMLDDFSGLSLVAFGKRQNGKKIPVL